MQGDGRGCFEWAQPDVAWPGWGGSARGSSAASAALPPATTPLTDPPPCPCSPAPSLPQEEGARLRLQIPDTVLLRFGTPVAWLYTDRSGHVRRQPQSRTTLEEAARHFARCAPEFETPFVAVARGQDGEPRLLQRAALASLVRLAGDPNRPPGAALPGAPAVLQAAVSARLDARYVAVYVNDGRTPTVAAYARRYSRRYVPARDPPPWDRSGPRGPDGRALGGTAAGSRADRVSLFDHGDRLASYYGSSAASVGAPPAGAAAGDGAQPGPDGGIVSPVAQPPQPLQGRGSNAAVFGLHGTSSLLPAEVAEAGGEGAGGADGALVGKPNAIDLPEGGSSEVDPGLRSALRRELQRVVRFVQRAHKATIKTLAAEFVRGPDDKPTMLCVLHAEWAAAPLPGSSSSGTAAAPGAADGTRGAEPWASSNLVEAADDDVTRGPGAGGVNPAFSSGASTGAVMRRRGSRRKGRDGLAGDDREGGDSNAWGDGAGGPGSAQTSSGSRFDQSPPARPPRPRAASPSTPSAWTVGGAAPGAYAGESSATGPAGAGSLSASPNRGGALGKAARAGAYGGSGQPPWLPGFARRGVDAWDAPVSELFQDPEVLEMLRQRRPQDLVVALEDCMDALAEARIAKEAAELAEREARDVLGEAKERMRAAEVQLEEERRARAAQAAEEAPKRHELATGAADARRALDEALRRETERELVRDAERKANVRALQDAQDRADVAVERARQADARAAEAERKAVEAERRLEDALSSSSDEEEEDDGEEEASPAEERLGGVANRHGDKTVLLTFETGEGEGGGEDGAGERDAAAACAAPEEPLEVSGRPPTDRTATFSKSTKLLKSKSKSRRRRRHRRRHRRTYYGDEDDDEDDEEGGWGSERSGSSGSSSGRSSRSSTPSSSSPAVGPTGEPTPGASSPGSPSGKRRPVPARRLAPSLRMVGALLAAEADPAGERYSVAKELSARERALRATFLHYCLRDGSFAERWPPALRPAGWVELVSDVWPQLGPKSRASQEQAALAVFAVVCERMVSKRRDRRRRPGAGGSLGLAAESKAEGADGEGPSAADKGFELLDAPAQDGPSPKTQPASVSFGIVPPPVETSRNPTSAKAQGPRASPTALPAAVPYATSSAALGAGSRIQQLLESKQAFPTAPAIVDADADPEATSAPLPVPLHIPPNARLTLPAFLAAVVLIAADLGRGWSIAHLAKGAQNPRNGRSSTSAKFGPKSGVETERGGGRSGMGSATSRGGATGAVTGGGGIPGATTQALDPRLSEYLSDRLRGTLDDLESRAGCARVSAPTTVPVKKGARGR